jgi:predicted naringenin-chalcone synthase
MPAYLQNITTLTPEHVYEQDRLRENMKELVAENELHRRVIHQIYSQSGIRTRHSILNDFHQNSSRELYFNGHGARPGTAIRNSIYEKEGRELFVKTARNLLNDNDRLSPGSITHLITISCTGFYAPGPDYDIINALGLNPSIERYNLGFMGCYAAISGLKLADRICQANPDANVMVIANELCTLHFQGGTSIDDLISTSVFADGAAGVIVSAEEPQKRPYFEIRDFASSLIGEGSKDMAWTIGDTGFNMVLSTYIPEILSKNLDGFLNPVLKQYNLTRIDIGRWAVHPGGRAILDRVEQQLDLPADTLKYSRKILSEFGNMSSATVLFVLREILDEQDTPGKSKNVLAMAFGPGITIESGLLIRHG